jgi:hypothetical protein
LSDGPSVAPPDTATAFRQKFTAIPFEATQRNIMFFHPKTEFRQEVMLLTHCRRGVPLITEPCCEPVKMGGRSTVSEGCDQRRRSVI